MLARSFPEFKSFISASGLNLARICLTEKEVTTFSLDVYLLPEGRFFSHFQLHFRLLRALYFGVGVEAVCCGLPRRD